MLMNPKSGFTIVELIIAVVIMGLIASIAIPRLNQSREAARLGEGVQLLRALRAAEDRWNLDHGAYTNDCNDLDITVAPTNFNAPTCANNGSVSIQRTGGAYTLTATAANVYSCAGCTAYLTRYLPS
jgi:prepilin-type N-terminal cleavage/methylation domain-containing protein